MNIWRRTTDVCRRLQDTVAEQGPSALRDDEAAQQHLEECDDCFRMLEALETLDESFEAMPTLDAPDELVDSLLRRLSGDPLNPETESHPTTASSWLSAAIRPLFRPSRPVRAALAFAMLVVVSTSLVLNSQFRRMNTLEGNFTVHTLEPVEVHSVEAAAQVAVVPPRILGQRVTEPEVREAEQKKLEAIGYLGGEGQPLEEVLIVTSEAPGQAPTLSRTTSYRSDLVEDKSALMAPQGNRNSIADLRANPQVLGDAKGDRIATLGDDEDLPIWVGTQADITFRGGSPRIEDDATGPFDGDDEARERVRERLRERLRNLPRGLQSAEDMPASDGSEPPTQGVDLKPSAPSLLSAYEQLIAGTADRELARRFLAERDAVVLDSQPANGYWINTYVPGDPMMRHLQARLAANDATRLIPAWRSHSEPPLLHTNARRPTQPFDPPPEAALAVQIHADRSEILDESRMLVQIGLAGTSRRWGRRSTMNVAVVLDLSGDIAPATGASLVALAAAFGEARDTNDRFRLIAAGRDGGELVTPKDFHRGPVMVATTEHLAAESPADMTLSLSEALRLAIGEVAEGDDPNAPLGSSAIILATSRPLGAEVSNLGELAHYSAVAGIPVSIVGVGDAVDPNELKSLALAGQGSRRLLREAADARGLVDRELANADRAVARAVRLDLRLAPGVRLVDIVGSRRHGEAGAERVREAERAIDQRMARNLGIAADRGDDEAGIQIVIPTFYAGDHHVVLLDVVAPGPGPIVDATVRFKDLVQLENATVRDHLTVARGEGDRGPLERNVLKNFLAQRLSDSLEDAAELVATDNPEAAGEVLSEHRSLLNGLQLTVPGFDRDPDLERDRAMLYEYVDRLGYRWIETAKHRRYLVDSLRYAALLKVLPAPEPVIAAG